MLKITSAQSKTLVVLLALLPTLSALTMATHGATGNTPTDVLGVGTSAGELTFSIIPGWTDRITSNDSANLNCSFTSNFDNTKGRNGTRSIVTTFNVQGG